MNYLEFNVFSLIFNSPEPLYLREIVNKSRLSYGTVQSILNRNMTLFNTRSSGKNKYFSFKKNINTFFLFQKIESEKMRQFIIKKPELAPFIESCRKLSVPIVLFGSFAKGDAKKDSDIDMLIISNKEIKLPEHLSIYKVHKIFVTPENLPEFKQQVLYKELRYNHLIICNMDYCIDKVLGCC